MRATTPILRNRRFSSSRCLTLSSSPAVGWVIVHAPDSVRLTTMEPAEHRLASLVESRTPSGYGFGAYCSAPEGTISRVLRSDRVYCVDIRRTVIQGVSVGKAAASRRSSSGRRSRLLPDAGLVSGSETRTPPAAPAVLLKTRPPLFCPRLQLFNRRFSRSGA